MKSTTQLVSNNSHANKYERILQNSAALIAKARPFIQVEASQSFAGSHYCYMFKSLLVHFVELLLTARLGRIQGNVCEIIWFIKRGSNGSEKGRGTAEAPTRRHPGMALARHARGWEGDLDDMVN